MITNTNGYSSFSSIDNIIDNLSKQYDDIDSIVINDIIFIIRPVTRKEYHYIYSSSLPDVDKKDFVCNMCILYPKNFDLDNCAAGVPEIIFNKIMEISYVGIEDALRLIEVHREEMEYLDNQMLCIIAKVFPAYKLNELEEMNMIQICKLYTRAEWIINNIRDGEKLLDIVEISRDAIDNSNEDEDISVNVTQQQDTDNKSNANKSEYVNKYNLPVDNMDDKPISKMTAEQKKALDDFYRRYPEFNKATDYAYTGKVRKEYKDPPALRVT